MDWKAHLRTALNADGDSPDDDVLEELSHHAAAAYEAARSEGFARVELVATLAGEPCIGLAGTRKRKGPSTIAAEAQSRSCG